MLEVRQIAQHKIIDRLVFELVRWFKEKENDWGGKSGRDVGCRRCTTSSCAVGVTSLDGEEDAWRGSSHGGIGKRSPRGLGMRLTAELSNGQHAEPRAELKILDQQNDR